MCRGLDPALFHGDNTDCAEALRICKRCPVAADCLADALEVERHLPIIHVLGVRGGMRASKRRHIILRSSTPRRAPVAECGTESGYYRHRRLNEPTCAACKAAHTAAEADRQVKANRQRVAKTAPTAAALGSLAPFLVAPVRLRIAPRDPIEIAS